MEAFKALSQVNVMPPVEATVYYVIEASIGCESGMRKARSE